jgi:thiol-disulfide isomerase/thioredoxin
MYSFMDPRKLFCGMLLALVAVVPAGFCEAAPDFAARTMSGQTFSNRSLRGSVVLVQFWTTWCPVCRADESAVEAINSEFARDGLVVLAVDVHEAEATVREYLQKRPRSCPIVLTEDTDLVAKYKPHSFPLYVAFDRDGNVAGTQSGGGGEASLRQLLRRAGMKTDPGSAIATGPAKSAVGERAAVGQMIVIPGAQTLPHSKPAAPPAATVFVLSNGERVETHDYVLTEDSVRMTVGGLQRSIAMSDIDMKASIAANHERGIELKRPSRHEVFLGR